MVEYPGYPAGLSEDGGVADVETEAQAAPAVTLFKTNQG
jgi:hypothetical protein